MKPDWTYPTIVKMAKNRQSNPNLAVHETFKALAIMVQEARGCSVLEAFEQIEMLAKNAIERIALAPAKTTEPNRLKIHYEDPPPATGS